MVEPESNDLLSTEPEESGGKGETIVELKQLKAQAKTVFTKTRRQLLVTIQQDNVTIDEIKEGCEALDIAQEEAMARLLNKYYNMADKDSKNSEKLSQEIDNIELEYSEAQNRAQSVFDEVRKAVMYKELVRKLESASQKQQASDMAKDKDDSLSSLPIDRSLHQPVNSQKSATEKSFGQLRDASESCLYDIEPQAAAFDQPSSGKCNSETRLFVSDNGPKVHSADSEMIGQDLWKQLKRVTIPIFSGDKRHIRIGEQPLWLVLTKLQPQLSTSYYSCDNVLLGKCCELLKVWVILQQHIRLQRRD